jgi:hypothetical protein
MLGELSVGRLSFRIHCIFAGGVSFLAHQLGFARGLTLSLATASYLATQAFLGGRRVAMETRKAQLFRRQYGDFSLDMLPLSAKASAVIERGVMVHPDDGYFKFSNLPALAAAARAGEDGIWRLSDGTLFVSVSTKMPDVTGAMVEWWFGWHGSVAQRYRLWHPDAHVWCGWKEDRSGASGKAVYVGNTSFVDEYVGTSFHQLGIEFVDPAHWGVPVPSGGAAVCARTTLRPVGLQSGFLCHLCVPEPGGGIIMHSWFWLRLSSPWLNQAVLGRLSRTVIDDRLGCDLFRHCAEEMQHLARFLPGLYARETLHKGR